MSTRWMLDTCVVSEQIKPHPHTGLQQWLGRHSAQCALAAASFGEIAYGIECLPHGSRRNGLSLWAQQLRRQFQARTLAADAEVWTMFGHLRASLRALGRPQDALDLVIAATAAVHGLTLVTRNVRHFADTGVPVFNPWQVPTEQTPTE